MSIQTFGFIESVFLLKKWKFISFISRCNERMKTKFSSTTPRVRIPWAVGQRTGSSRGFFCTGFFSHDPRYESHGDTAAPAADINRKIPFSLSLSLYTHICTLFPHMCVRDCANICVCVRELRVYLILTCHEAFFSRSVFFSAIPLPNSGPWGLFFLQSTIPVTSKKPRSVTTCSKYQ